jgi:hypothetical protein
MTTDLFLSSFRARRGQCCYPSDPGGEKASPARREGRRRGDEQRAAARGREAGWWSSWEAGSSFSRRKGSSGRSRAAGRCLCVRRSRSRMEVMAAGGGGEGRTLFRSPLVWVGAGRTVSSEDYSLDTGARAHTHSAQCSSAPKLANEMRQRAGWTRIKSRVKWRNNERLILTEPE